MEAAGKVQSMASVKTRMTEASGARDVSAANGDFTKLLQVKQDLAKDTDSGKTEGTKDSKNTKKPDTKAAEDKKDSGKDQTEEVSVPQETDQQEALEKAAMQLAAAQMMVVVPEEPAEAEAVVSELTGEGLEAVALSQEVTLENQTGETEMTQELFREDVTVPVEERKAETSETKPEAKTDTIPVPVTTAEKPKAEVKADTRRQESQEDYSGSESGQVQETDTSSQQMAGAGEFKVSGQTEPLFRETGRPETIPLRTAPENLPQDLGKTLAARLPEAGRTLTVELEPASLGKLTIRMTYEAGRAAVSIMATNPRTLEILSQKAAEIASILEEKTGQETVILTQQPQEEEAYQENKHGGNAKEEQEQEQQGREKQQHSDSFAQQLRLGLV